ncbi:ssdbp [Antheraea pernyi nucleopolyhedrovirus]|uniref:SsDNA binding protein n=1 Tax=Antheraea pernyi nuclear polyhedrosis virus TaxID=161494 RepID=Q1HGY9_NPVAP|nr:ssdbp [Antheraea pernyi nucleopolyhedrovirus]ABF50344.1 ssdbp [Antheraea pernyi nucleopolyhedrovirus]BAX08884.1 ssDNA binding protein [Antheraea pernyi nucleopolyhedrovirus]BBD50570.1 ssDNA binding protein [Antheraea yamamai nucleopolyhedrovirus]BBD50722.1 ssDNA binding protein [Samia cynthia nucleopolyhedrovirus]
MVSKRANPDNDETQGSKRVAQETQLMPFNNSGFIMTIKDDGVRTFAPVGAVQAQRNMGWQHMVLANCRALDFTAINTNYGDVQYLKDKFAELKGLSNYYKWREEPQPDDKVCIMEPAVGKCTYTIGLRVKGRPNGFAISETGSVHRSKSTYGQFLSTTWSSIHEHNEVFGKVMNSYYKYEYPLKLESSVCAHLPEKEHERELKARQFLWVRRENNPEVYATGQLDRPLDVVPMTLDEFDRLFEIGKTDGPSQEVPVVVCGRIDGVKYGKEIQMTDVNGRKFSEKPYSLAFKPILYLLLEP